MASFTVTLPDGSSYDVDGLPDDATENDALALVLAENPDAAEADNSLQQWMGVATRALLPYGVAAGAGAAAGAPFAGVGAIPGAAAGVLALGAGDIGTGIYNLAATPFGAPRMTLPSEAIRQTYESAGLPGTREPATTPQRIFSSGLEAATGAGGTARAISALAPTLRAGTTARGVATELGRGARAQAVGGAGSGGLTQTAVEGGETDPLKLFLVSLAGGVGGTLAGGRTPRPLLTGEDIRKQASQTYRQAEQQGVYILPNVADDLATQLETTLQRQGAAITQRDRAPILRVIRDLRNRPHRDLSFEELEKLRSDLGMVGRSAETGKVTPVGAQANRMAGIVQDKLDDFFDTLDLTQVSSGDPQRAVELVKQARQQYKNARKGEILEQVLTKIDVGAGKKPPIQELQERLAPIVSDKRLMKKFNDEERKVLKSLQSGTLTENSLAKIGELSPELNVTKLLGYAIPTTVAASTNPAYLGGVAAVGGAALASRALANRMALRRASDVAENVLAGRSPPGLPERTVRAAGRGAAYVPPVVLGSQSVNNAFLTDAYGNQYDAQGNRMSR
jgi:hypothetical protein